MTVVDVGYLVWSEEAGAGDVKNVTVLTFVGIDI
jgi:hypothetical protein